MVKLHWETRELLHKVAIICLVTLPLAGVLVAIYFLWNQYVFVTDIVLLLVLYAFTAMGVTIGYHRMLTHQSFSAPNWLRALLVIAGAMAFDGQPLGWAATHIYHHAHSDEEGDPHSPLEGFWHSHMGWLFTKRNFKDPQELCPQLANDPVIRFVDRTYVLWLILSLAIPYAIGGFTGLVWGGGVRVFLVNHVTWSVNSICHTFGKRHFETTDQSRNNWLIGLLAFGEGWHNNHHAFPANAFHGMRWWQIDMSGSIIRLWERIGLVWDVKRVTPEAEAAQQLRTEQMMERIAELKELLAQNIQSAKSELTQLWDSLPDARQQQLSKLQAKHTATLKRLNTIQHYVSTVRIMKQPRLTSYTEEVRELVAEAKERLQREVLLATQ